jgi:hypothetical protein
VGSGRPKGAQAKLPAHEGALRWLMSVVNDPMADQARKDRCAMAVLSYERRAGPGKKEIAESEAQNAGVGTSWEDLVK